MIKFGEITDLATGEMKKIYGPVRLQGQGWYIEVKPTTDMQSLEVRCSGNVEGESYMIIHPVVGNMIEVSSEASRRNRQPQLDVRPSE